MHLFSMTLAGSAVCLLSIPPAVMAATETEPLGAGSFYVSLPDGAIGPSDTNGQSVAPRITDDFTGPVPTNTWWSSLVWTRYPGKTFGEAMHPHPLSVKASSDGLEIGQVNAATPTGAGYGYHFTDSTHALTIGVEGLQSSDVRIADASDWTLTARWDDGQRTMDATFGRGLPAVVAEIIGGTPSITINPGSGGASNIDNQGAHVILQCADSTWGLFAPEGTTWTQQGNLFLAPGAQKIAAAVLPDSNPVTIQRFVDRALTVVRETSVSWEWNPADRTIETTYDFTTDTQEAPLICLYGHHVEHSNQDDQDWGQYITARGPMSLRSASSFTVNLPCPAILPLLPDVGSIDPTRLESLLESVVDDDNFPSDTYWFGKAVGRHGQLALIADQLGDLEARDQLIQTMKDQLEKWLSVDSSGDLNSADRLQAESFDDSNGVTIEEIDGADEQAVTGFNGGDWIKLSNINFSSQLPNRALIRIASGTSGSAMVSLRLDSVDGPVISQAGIGNTGGWTSWTEIALGISIDDIGQIEGVRDIYVTCETPYTEDIFSLDWFTFDYGGGGSSASYFAYDPTWSTLIGYPASYGADSELNDHHFHYGYYIMAASIIARFDPEWAQVDNWGGMIELLIKDAANWDRTDDRFCFLRHMEPYVGYSYASGHAGFAAGNNQESSSEGLNFASACVSWGAHTNNDEILELGLFLLAAESLAVERYWFDVDETIFPDEMPHPVAGIVWDSGADYATWWTGNPEEIHGINVLPVTGGSLYLGQRPDSITRCWNHLLEENGGEPTVWQDILWSYLGLADADAALQRLDATPNYWPEAGDSKARTYHWLAALTGLGQLKPQITGDTPFSAVFSKDQITTYVAHNPGTKRLEVTFSDGQRICVPAGETYWAHTNQDGECPATADVNGDGVVNVNDLLIVLGDWGPCIGCQSDLDGDGIVAVNDVLALLAAWTP